MNIRREDGLAEERLSHSIIGAFYAVNRQLGFGFLESVYCAALEFELRKRGHRVARETTVTVHYDGVPIAHQRLDMIVDGRVIVEVKAGRGLHREACHQLYNYLRAANLEVGFLFVFARELKFFRVYCPLNTANPGQ